MDENPDSIQLDPVLPPADLRPWIGLFYRFRSSAPAFDGVEHLRRGQFRFRLSGGSGSYRFADGVEESAAACHLVAPSEDAIHGRATGPVLAFGMGLTPAGWDALVPDGHARGRVIDATELWGEPVHAAALALGFAPDVHAMVAIAAPLIRRLVGQDPALSAFIQTVDEWLAADPSPALSALVARTGLSRRQVERRCNAIYGAPPKLIARRHRALRAAAALASGTGAHRLLLDGFYDQSHLIREVKEFTGLTPGRLRADPGLLTHRS